MLDERPNILMIIGEDTGRFLGCYGDPLAKTPNLDALAARGRRYTSAFSTAPVCAPARSSIVTGRYPTAIGTHHMRSTLIDAPRIFTQELRDDGYTVRWPTKLDFNFDPQPGWCDDQTPWLEDLANGETGQKPWLYYANLVRTHESGMWPNAADGTPPQRPTDPPWLTADRPVPGVDPNSVRVPEYLPDTPVVRADIARHYENVAAIDSVIGRILEALHQSGQAERTVVVFLCDHGRGLPREKRWCYAPGVHMPLLIAGPGVDPGIDHQLVSWVDIAPTLLSLAGVTPPPTYDGRDILDCSGARAEFAFGGRDRMDEAFDRVRFVSDGRYHFIRNDFPCLPYAQRVAFMERMPTTAELRRMHAGGVLDKQAAVWMSPAKPPRELYDIQCDPDCVHNLIDQPEYAPIQRRLEIALSDWQQQIGDLGLESERCLIERSLVKDRIAEYRQRLKLLPKGQQVGRSLTITEVEDLNELKAGCRSALHEQSD
ncbi:MAG: sulfatase [Planctomycetota bacterium]